MCVVFLRCVSRCRNLMLFNLPASVQRLAIATRAFARSLARSQSLAVRSVAQAQPKTRVFTASRAHCVFNRHARRKPSTQIRQPLPSPGRRYRRRQQTKFATVTGPTKKKQKNKSCCIYSPCSIRRPPPRPPPVSPRCPPEFSACVILSQRIFTYTEHKPESSIMLRSSVFPDCPVSLRFSVHLNEISNCML